MRIERTVSRLGATRWLTTLTLATVMGVIGAAIAGCSGGESKVGRVEGVVRLNGKPLASGTVRFLPAAGRGAHGKIQPDGTFTLGTYGEADGALIGKHQVAIVAFEPGKAGRPDPSAPRAPMKSLVPERYMAEATSGLSFEVKSGDNHPEFELTSP